MSNKNDNKIKILELYAQAKQYFDNKDYDKAIEYLTNILDLDSNDKEACFNRGIAYRKLEQNEKAIIDYTKAIEIDPKYIDAYFNRANAYDDLDQYDKALIDYNKAIEIDPNFNEAYYNRANIYHKLGQYEKAIEDYNKAIEINPHDKDAYSNRGVAYFELKDFDKAIIDYNKAIEIDPNFNEAYYNRANMYDDLGQYEKAILDYNKAIEINPHDKEAYVNRGANYSDLGQYEKAILDYNKALELDPEYADAYVNRGVAYFELKDFDKSLEDLSKAIKLDSTEKIYFNNRGELYHKLGRYDEALKDYDKSLALDPNYKNAYFNRANTYNNLGQYDKALIDYNKAIELDPNYKNSYNNRGKSYYELEQYKEAFEDFIKYYGSNNLSLIIRTLIELNKSTQDIETLCNQMTKYYPFDKDDVFNNIVENDTTNEDYKKIWFYQAVILHILSVKKGYVGDISSYTSLETLLHLGFNYKKDDKDDKEPPLRMTSLSSANDPKEGLILKDILEQHKINIDFIPSNDLIPFQISFTKNKDSLTMFRLYGKKDDKEATGVSLVFDKNFFDTEGGSTPTTLKLATEQTSKVDDTDKKDKIDKHSLFYVLYYNEKTNTLLWNKKDKNSYGKIIEIPINESCKTPILSIEKENDDVHDEEVLQYCFYEIFSILKNKESNIYYNLLINLQYLIKHDAFFEETELRILHIGNINNSDEYHIDPISQRVYRDYLPILDKKEKYLKEIILGTKIENGNSQAEMLKVFLKKEKNMDMKVSLSQAPLR